MYVVLAGIQGYRGLVLKSMNMKRFLLLPLVAFLFSFQILALEKEVGSEYYPAIVRVDNGSVIDALVEQGAVVYASRGNLALVCMPDDLAASMARAVRSKAPDRLRSRHACSSRGLKGISRVEFSRKGCVSLDSARLAMGADRIMSGEAFNRPFNGKGVVVGICDIGFDPLHPAFFTADGTESRLRRLVQFRESHGERLEMRTLKEYEDWQTDNSGHTHATHVAGILAGACASEGYQGIAGGADMVVTVSELSEVGLLAGAEEILAYARQEGKPCVINMSMGNYIGPHDGTSLFSQYLDMIGKEAIVCMSAGNEGRHNNSIAGVMESDHDSLPFRLANYCWTNFDMNGITDIWSSDSRPLRLRPVIYDETLRKTVYEFKEFAPEADGVWSVSSDPSDLAYDESFACYYDGWMEIYSEVNPDNGRFNVTAYYDARTKEQSDAGPWARYNLAFVCSGKEGVRIDVYADGTNTFIKEVPGGPKPTSDCSISDLACGENVISVGMYVCRRYSPLLSGEVNEGANPAGIVHPSSSYGTLADGRRLPLTVAPGGNIISACSYYYAKALSAPEDVLAGRGESGGREYFWVHDVGTSMASPYVAGFMALWLEADPTLTPAEAREFIVRSNTMDIDSPSDPRNPNGWFDPVGGMTLVVGKTSTGMPSKGTDRMFLRFAGGRLMVYGALPDTEAAVYSADGTLRAMSRTDSSGHAEIDMDPAASGLFIVRAGCSSEKIYR